MHLTDIFVSTKFCLYNIECSGFCHASCHDEVIYFFLSGDMHLTRSNCILHAFEEEKHIVSSIIEKKGDTYGIY